MQVEAASLRHDYCLGTLQERYVRLERLVAPEEITHLFRYQLTVVGQFATAIVAEEVRDNRFRIKTDKPNVMVSWQVTGIRQDAWANAHRVEVEVQKTEAERGKYLHPEEHDQPATAGMFPAGMFHFEQPISEETEPDSGKPQGE